jgi:membrane-bound serine protease (ClpP class)
MALMRRVAPLLFLSVFAFALLTQVAAAQGSGSSGRVVVVKVDGSIDRTQADYLKEAIEEAEAEGSTVVVQLDSAGTLDQDAVGLAERIHEATVPVVVWIGPAPAQAKGAGLLFRYAASMAAVAPGVGVGPLEPLDLVDAANTDLPRGEDLRALATGWVREAGRPTPVAFPEGPVPAQAALDGNIAQVAAVSVTELLAEIDGMTVVTADGEIELRTKIALGEDQEPVNVRFTSLGPIDRVLHAAASPAAIYVLLVFGLAALAFELTQPGFGFAGFGGVAMLGLGIYGLAVVPFSWLGLVLLVGGVAMMTADVLVRRLGVLTAAGLVAFVAGSFLTFRGVSDLIRVSPWLIGLASAASILYYGFGLTVAVQARERITSTQKGLVGLVGEARGDLDPEGPVFVKGTLWRGKSQSGPIPQGSRVRVRGVDGLILRVETEPEAPAEPSPDPIAGT